jgi:hypothetical protein
MMAQAMHLVGHDRLDPAARDGRAHHRGLVVGPGGAELDDLIERRDGLF